MAVMRACRAGIGGLAQHDGQAPIQCGLRFGDARGAGHGHPSLFQLNGTASESAGPWVSYARYALCVQLNVDQKMKKDRAAHR